MNTLFPWGQHVRTLMQEHRISERRFCAHTGMNRSSLRRFLAGETLLDLNHVTVMLAAFGYEIGIVKAGEPTIPPKQPKKAPVKKPRVCEAPPPPKAKKLRLKRSRMGLACETLGY